MELYTVITIFYRLVHAFPDPLCALSYSTYGAATVAIAMILTLCLSVSITHVRIFFTVIHHGYPESLKAGRLILTMSVPAGKRHRVNNVKQASSTHCAHKRFNTHSIDVY